MDTSSWHLHYASNSGDGTSYGTEFETTNDDQGHSSEVLVLSFACSLEAMNFLLPFLFTLIFAML